MTTDTRYISMADAARARGVSRTTVSLAALRGTLTVVEVGGRRMILRDATYEAWLATPVRPRT